MHVHGYASPIPCFETDGISLFTDNLSAQAKYRALRAIRWRYGSRIKYRVRMRLNSVVPEDGLRYTDWSNVPYLNRWDDDRQLKLNDNWADNRNDNWSSPSVRDCS